MKVYAHPPLRSALSPLTDCVSESDWRGRQRSVDPRLDEIRLAVERAFQAGVTWVEIATIFEGCRHSVEHRISMLDSQSP